MPVSAQELVLVGSCNGWSLEAAKQSHRFSHRALGETLWQHECRLQLDKTGELEFQVVSRAEGWAWRLHPEAQVASRLVDGNPHGVSASLSLFEEDAGDQGFRVAEAAGAHVLVKVLLSPKELLVWYERAQAEPRSAEGLMQLEELPEHLKDLPPARWITVVWPYVPMRDKPEVSGRLVSVVKHGAQLEFEDLAPGRPVTLQDLLENSYLKIWSLGQDGSRQKSGWVSVRSDHGVHFAPFSESTDAQSVLKPLLDTENVEGKQQQFELIFEAQRAFKLNLLPRAEPPHADLPAGTADLLLLKKHRLYAPVNGPIGHITVCGLPGGCAGALAEWLLGAFDLQVTVKTLTWLASEANREKARQAGAGDRLLLLLLERPLAWALAASAGVGSGAGASGCWATRLRWREGGTPGELEYAPEAEGGAGGATALLGTPLLFDACVHQDGAASVWACCVHGAVAAAATAGAANVAGLRAEDLLFRAQDVDATFGDLVVARRRAAEDGPASAALAEDGPLPRLLRSHARLSLLRPGAAAHVDAATAAVCAAVGYASEEEAASWSSRARDMVGWVQEGEYRAFDPESKEDARGSLDFLAEHGYVVFRGVAGRAELERAEALLWEFLGQCGAGIKRGMPSTWALPSFSRKGGDAATEQNLAMWPAEDGTGIISGNGIGQSAFMWYLRGLPRLRKAFGLIFGTDDLISSFDGAGIFRPYGHDASWKSRSTWYHVDQGDGKHGFHSVQGLVSLTPVSAETGGLVVVPGSHLCHEDLLKRPENRGAGRLHLEDGDPALREWSKDAAGAIVVPLEPGDAVLWDSRTVHCSTHALRDAPPEVLCGNRLLRAVGYISMSPTAWATRATLEKRMAVFQDSRRPLRNLTSTHNAHDLHIVKEGPISDTVAVDLSDEQLELAVGRDGGLLSTSSFEPGQPSFLPARTYRCLPDGAPVRTAPSAQRGDCIRGLTGGLCFRAHRFGDWLRLGDEEWVQACHAEPDTAMSQYTPPQAEEKVEEVEDLFEAFSAAFG